MAKYRLYADYRFTVDCGVVEADSKEEAIEKGFEERIIDGQHTFCHQCESEIMDHPTLCEDGVTADIECEEG